MTTLVLMLKQIESEDWIIDSVIDHTISISKCNLLARSYIKLLNELDQNTDGNVCFKWCLARYLNPADYDPAKITKTVKDFAKMLDVKYINFPVKIRHIYKIENKISIGITVFGYENEKYPIHVSKQCREKNMLTYH